MSVIVSIAYPMIALLMFLIATGLDPYYPKGHQGVLQHIVAAEYSALDPSINIADLMVKETKNYSYIQWVKKLSQCLAVLKKRLTC